jgi:hypothetical protein
MLSYGQKNKQGALVPDASLKRVKNVPQFRPLLWRRLPPPTYNIVLFSDKNQVLFCKNSIFISQIWYLSQIALLLNKSKL